MLLCNKVNNMPFILENCMPRAAVPKRCMRNNAQIIHYFIFFSADASRLDLTLTWQYSDGFEGPEHSESP